MVTMMMMMMMMTNNGQKDRHKPMKTKNGQNDTHRVVVNVAAFIAPGALGALGALGAFRPEFWCSWCLRSRYLGWCIHPLGGNECDDTVAV